MTTAVRMGCILGLTWTVYGLIACMKALRRAAHTILCALGDPTFLNPGLAGCPDTALHA